MGHESLEIKNGRRCLPTTADKRVALAEDEVTVLTAAPTAKGALAASASKGAPSPILYRVPETLDAVQMGDML
jgi:hypothetical protein